MKLTFLDRKEVPETSWGRCSTKYFAILNEFADNDATAAMIEDIDLKNPQTAINSAIKRYGMTGIKCISRNNRLYLIKET